MSKFEPTGFSTTLPTWGTALSAPEDITEPDAGEKADGYDTPGQKPNRAWHNWMGFAVGGWLGHLRDWLDALAGAAVPAFATLDAAVTAKTDGDIATGSPFVMTRQDAEPVGTYLNGQTLSATTVTDMDADGEYVVASSGDKIYTLARDLSSATVRYTSAADLSRIATAGARIYAIEVTGGSDRVLWIERGTWTLGGTVLAGGDPNIDIETDGEFVYLAVDPGGVGTNEVNRRTLSLGNGSAWGAPYVHGSVILDIATDGRYVYVGGGPDGAMSTTDHLKALDRADGTEVWASGSTIGGGADGEVWSIATDGRYVYVGARNSATGDSIVYRLTRDGVLAGSTATISGMDVYRVAVDSAYLVAVCGGAASGQNIRIYDKHTLALVRTAKFDSADTGSPFCCASDGDRIYVGGILGSIEGDAQVFSRGSVPRLWRAEDVTVAGRRYHSVFAPTES